MSLIRRISNRLFKLAHPKLGTILILHRVIDKRSELTINREIEITPDFLEKTILYYREKGYRFVTLDEVKACLTKRNYFKQPFICFTLDDGYIDNYEIAYPIFKKLDCPFAIYVTTDFPSYKAIVWWYVLEDLVMKNETLHLSDGSVYVCKTVEQKNKTFNQLHKKIGSLHSTLLSDMFEKLFECYNFSFKEKIKELAMSYDQIKLIATDNLCTIASHTVTHPKLSSLTDALQYFELAESKKLLEQIIGKDVLHFSYPFGNYNSESIKLAFECGYETATFALGGVVRKGQSPWKLARKVLIEK